MAYILPETVVSPRATVRSVDILYNTGPGGWSAAHLIYRDGQEALGLRWNGDEGGGMGQPQSRATPTWFVVPDDLANLVRDEVERLSHERQGGLLDGYRAMAADSGREAEAQQWCENLMGDGSDEET